MKWSAKPNNPHAAGPLSDSSPMPWGAHAGQPMANLKADYLHFIWHQGPALKGKPGDPVADYIRRCLPALRKENKDLIWI